MSMLKWAEQEVEYALKEALGTDDTDDLSFVYYKSCLDSALKAFKSLCEDNHSGMSISITKNILMRLIESKPLTVIDDTEDGWNKVEEREDGSECYQNKRMPSLFKYIDADGKVEYDDLDRCICKDINNGSTYHNGLASQYLNKNYPITMPYYPSDKPFIFYTEDFCLFRPYADEVLKVCKSYIGCERNYWGDGQPGPALKKAIDNFMADNREEIIDKAADKLAERLSRTKVVKEAAAQRILEGV